MAQNKKEYTNFNDTIFDIGEVVIITNQKKQAEVLKLDVPKNYLPISTATLPSEILVERGIQNIQDAARFLPGVRIQTTYGAFQQMSIRGFDHSVIMVDGIRDERSSINNQLELNGNFYTGEVKHNYLAGYSLIYLHRDSYTGYNFGSKGDDVVGPGLTGHGTVYNPHSIGWMDTKFSKVSVQRYWIHGFYLQDLIELSEQWKVLLAGRYDLYSYRRATGVDVINGGRSYNEPDGSAFSKIVNKAFTFRVGGVYLPTKDLSIFASVGTYFKPIMTFYSPDVIYVDKDGMVFTPKDGSEVFKPEKGYQIEVGARYELSNKLQADFSVVYINKYNMTRTIANKGDETNAGTATSTITGQVGRMDSKGFDISLTWNPIRGLMLSTGYGYTDAQVREMADNPYVSSDATKGLQYAYIPKNTFYVLGDYTVSKGWLKNFGINLSVTYEDKVYRNSTNSSVFPSYWMTDLGLNYKLKNNVRLGLNINNLFDKDYFNQSLGNQYVPGIPRNFLLSATYLF